MATRGLYLSLLSAFLWVGCGGDSTECKSSSDCPAGYECTSNMCLPPLRHGDTDNHNGGGDSDERGADPGDSQGGDEDVPQVTTDKQGPEITIESPVAMGMYGGVITIRAKIEDPSGIDEKSITVTVAGDPSLVFLSDLYSASGAYQIQFDTAQLEFMLYPSIEVTAYDNVGNKSTAGHEFAVDNSPPILGLESPVIQATRVVDGREECSWPFNPLGPSAVKHGEVVDRSYKYGTMFYPRSRMEDEGNSSSDVVGTWTLYSGLDNFTTKLYVLSKTGMDAGVKLVVGDGPSSTCRRIGSRAEPDSIHPSPTQALVLDMVPIPPRGNPIFMAGMELPPVCAAQGTAEEPPEYVCESSLATAITVWASHGGNKDPAIYSLRPYVSDSGALCTGAPFDIRNIDVDGPVCLAVTARDKTGNIGVSKPIAICIDRDGVGNECAGWREENSTAADTIASQCTDGCQAAESWSATYPF